MLLTWLEILILIYAAFLSIFHLSCEKLPVCIKRSHNILLSYGGGTLLATIFLVFLPETVHLTPTNLVYPLILIGFISFFITEKYLYQHVKEPRTLEKDLYHLHATGFFIDHFIKGFILITIIELRPLLGLITAIPFLIHTLSSSIALQEIHKIKKRNKDKIFLSTSTLIGTITGILFKIHPTIERIILAFVLGMMLFMVSRDILPKKKEGKPKYILLGVTTILIIWITIQYL